MKSSYLNNVLKSKIGLNKRIKPIFIKQIHVSRSEILLHKFLLGKELKKKVQNNISFLIKIKSYKGIRHQLKYPVRGQRTHTNAKTRKNHFKI